MKGRRAGGDGAGDEEEQKGGKGGKGKRKGAIHIE